MDVRVELHQEGEMPLDAEVFSSLGYDVEKIRALPLKDGATWRLIKIYVDRCCGIEKYKRLDLTGMEEKEVVEYTPDEVTALPNPEDSVQARVKEFDDYLKLLTEKKIVMGTLSGDRIQGLFQGSYLVTQEKFRKVFASELELEEELK